MGVAVQTNETKKRFEAKMPCVLGSSNFIYSGKSVLVVISVVKHRTKVN